MVFRSAEGSFEVPVTDVVSYSFNKQRIFDDEEDVLLDVDDSASRLNTKTYRQLVRRLTAGFRALGLQDDDAVLCHLPNSVYCPVLFMSIVGAGGIWTPSNPANKLFEIGHFLDLAEPPFILTTETTLPTILEACNHYPNATRKIFVVDFERLPGILESIEFPQTDLSESHNETTVRPFEDLLLHGEQDWRAFSQRVETHSPAIYFPTSGTTGLPKLAMVSHSNLIAHHSILHEDMPYDVKRLISLPMFHLFATSYVFIQPLRYGHKTYIQKRFQLEDYLRNLCKYQITETYMPPPMMVAVINAKAEAQNLMQSVRHIGTGAAPISADTINQMRAVLAPGATVSCMWGMTELGIVSSFRYGEHDNTGSVGKLMRGVEARLADAEGRIVNRDDTPGELQVRCPGIMLGYRKVAMTNEDKKWFRTGDIGIFRNGKLYCVGRTKELIKVKGWQVAPAELEAVLLQHPEVVDVAVRGVVAKDEISEVPRAYIVRRNYQEAASASLAEELYHFCQSRLASYKALDGGVVFVAEIPRTASGKIQRAKLAFTGQLRG